MANTLLEPKVETQYEGQSEEADSGRVALTKPLRETASTRVEELASS